MRQHAYDIVYGTLEEQEHSDRLFHQALGREPHRTGQEKRFLKRLSYGTIERCVELDAVLSRYADIPVKKMTPPVRTVLRMALYEIFYMDQIPEAVSCHEAVELIKRKEGSRHTGFVNGVLRTVLRHPGEREAFQDWVRLSLPKPLYDHLAGQYGKKTVAKIGEAFLAGDRGITLHMDPSKISPSDFRKQLEDRQIAVRNARYMPDACIVEHIEDVTTLPGYDKGWFFVQDESSMLPVCCAGIQPGDRVVDVCSAPGGKAVHALLRLGQEGFLSARDISTRKVAKIRENIRRMGYTNAECKIWDGTVADPDWQERADVVLVDVPCSGIGIIGRKPEIKYHAVERAGQLVPIQRKIALAASQLVRPGGVLIYSTCTINHEENEQNVQWLVEQTGLQPESLDPYLPESLQNKMTAKGMLQMLPGLQDSDGFFVARLVKTKG